MTALDWMLAVNWGTGLITAAFAAGLLLAYSRAMHDDSPLVRHISCSTMLMATACAIEAIRVRDTNSLPMHLLAIVYNLVVLYAYYRGLQAIHRMIPEEYRSHYTWLTAPLYPPWVWTAGLFRFARRWQEYQQRLDRRKAAKPIEFPDRRRHK